jgi:hypothetical protein
MRLKNKFIQPARVVWEFQMIHQEALTRSGGFQMDLVNMQDADMFRRLSKNRK